ncbi:phosphate ABC transporter permease subunit PstC [Anaeromyxobacter oryzae]|uniref:phosphate ABC transporter permease subunit PstC n=1 Tax=Anaeromyxobacter oryzae TaxID=2918170 RepID=UPI0020BF15F1|nr:phosphate ABC transporter permease subunit PstC [Anaeromyxobacter oryzae]
MPSPAEITGAQLSVTPSIARSRRFGNAGDRVWATVLVALGGAVLLIAGVIVWSLFGLSRPLAGLISIPRFLAGQDWDPVASSFGALPFIYGTLVTSAVAMVVALPVSVGLAVFMVEFAPARARPIVSFLVETLAAIPSVVYGLWGLFVLVPWLRGSLEPALVHTLGFLPLFKGPSVGLGYLGAGLILAVMILPTISSVTTEVLKTVPPPLREGALALGATRWEAIRMAILPYARGGIMGAALLGLGRALGETMAVTMVIGNSPEIHASLLAPGYSLPSVIANEFAEAASPEHLAALAGLGLVLFGLSIVLNAVARLLVHRVQGSAGRIA